MPTRKSDLVKKLSDYYPNFYKRDLNKLVEIFISETKNSLKRHERVELRDVFTIETKLQKAKNARNPKTNEKIFVDKKYTIHFRASKMWSKKINEEK